MASRKHFAVFAALAGILLVTAFAIQLLLNDEPSERPPAQIPGKPAVAALPESPQAEAELAQEEFLSTTEAAGWPTEHVRSEEDTPTEVAASENFDLAEAAHLRVRVILPVGTPADEKVELRLLATADPSTDSWERIQDMGQGSGASDIDSYVSTLPFDSDLSATLWWSKRSLGADGQATMPYPKEARRIAFLLDGDYLYLEEITQGAPAELSPEVVLRPALGARLLGRCVLPANYQRNGVDAAALEGEVSVFSLKPVRSNGSEGMFYRRAELSDKGEFVLRALPAPLELSYTVELRHLLAAERMGSVSLTAGESRQIELQFRLGGGLRGRVLDAAGQPVASANVHVRAQRGRGFGNNSGYSVTSDEQGSFAFYGLEKGPVAVSAQSAGWKDTEGPEVELLAEEVIENYEVVLERGLAVSGRVDLPDGSPAAGCALTLSTLATNPGFSWRNTVATCTSDEDGSFLLQGLEEGSFTLDATFTGHESSSDAESAVTSEELPSPRRTPSFVCRIDGVQAGTSGHIVRLSPTLSISGRVLQDLGEPVSKYQVRATPTIAGAESNGDPFQRVTQVENEEGRFSLQGLIAGEYRLTVEADGYQSPDEPALVTVPSTEGEIILRVTRAASVAGRVVDPLGNPVAGARVGPASGEQAGPRRGGFRASNSEGTQSDELGAFVLENLPAGSIAIEADAEQWALSETTTVELVAGQRVEGIVLSLRNGGRIVGDAFDETGAPLVGRSVALGMDFFGFGGGSGVVSTDSAGHFVLDNVDPGNYMVTVTPPQAEIQAAINGAEDESAVLGLMSKMLTEKVVVVEGQEVYVRLGAEPLQPVEVSGKVSKAGQPVATGMVFAIAEGKAILQGMKMGKIEEGRYAFTLDRPGAYVFGVQSDGNDGPPLEFEVDVPDVERFEQDLAIPMGMIRGRIYGPDGQAAPHALLQVTRAEGGFSLSLDTDNNRMADADGRYQLENLRPGRYVVRAGGSGYAGESAAAGLGVEVRSGIELGRDQVLEGIDFHLKAAGKVRGKVVDSNGNPVSGVSIFARNEQGELLAKMSTVSSGADGEFLYGGIQPGLVTFSARGSSVAAPESEAVSVRAGETAEVELRCEPATMLLVTVEDEEGESMRATIQVRDSAGHEVASMFSEGGAEQMMMEGLDSKKSRVGPLPPGKYEVIAIAKDGRTNSKPVQLSGKEERSLRIKIRD